MCWRMHLQTGRFRPMRTVEVQAGLRQSSDKICPNKQKTQQANGCAKIQDDFRGCIVSTVWDMELKVLETYTFIHALLKAT